MSGFQKKLFIAIAIFIFFIGALLYILESNLKFGFLDEILKPLQKRISLQNEQRESQIMFFDDVFNNNYMLARNVFTDPELSEEIANTRIDTYNIDVRVTNDQSKIGHSFKSDDGSDISGSGFLLDEANQLLTIYIYLEPTLSNEDKLYEMNANFLTAFLLANSKLGDPTNLTFSSSPNSQYAQTISKAGDINMTAADSSNYFVIYNNK